MKKIIFVLLAMLTTSVSVHAGDPTEKLIQKTVKTRLKELKKGGWEVFGTALPLDAALSNYYQTYFKLGDNGCEQVGNGSESENKTILHAKAVADAMRGYSTKASNNVSVETVDALNSISGKDLEDFRSTYESKVNKTINSQLKEYFSIIRPSQTIKGCYEMQTFFLVDEREAVKARLQAMKETFFEKKFNKEMLAPLETAVGLPVK